MKIKCTKEHLLHAVGLAEKMSGKNLTLPVLNCLLLQATKKTLIVRATNLELGIEIEVPCNVDVEGSVAIPGAVLLNTLSHSYTNTTVTLAVLNNNLTISTPTGNTTIKTYPYDDFPTLPRIDAQKTITLKPDAFLNGLRSVWYSASLSAIKPELASVYIYTKGGKMVFVGTDSFRLAEKIIVVDTDVEFEPFLIPIRNVPEIIRVLEQSKKEIELHLNPNQVAFVFDKLYFTSRLIDGTFPDYKQIIPKESTTEAVMLKQDLLNILKKTIIFSDKFNQIRFSIKPAKKQFTMSSQNADVGETVDSVQATLRGEALDINFNHRYITDCFQSIPVDSAVLQFSGLGKPMIIKGVGDNSFLYLVMPMNK